MYSKSEEQNTDLSQELLTAIKNQDIALMTNILKKDPELCDSVYFDEETGKQFNLLYYATLTRNYTLCSLLINSDAPISSGSESAAFAAIKEQATEILELFLKKDPSLKDRRSTYLYRGKTLEQVAKEQNLSLESTKAIEITKIVPEIYSPRKEQEGRDEEIPLLIQPSKTPENKRTDPFSITKFIGLSK